MKGNLVFVLCFLCVFYSQAKNGHRLVIKYAKVVHASEDYFSYANLNVTRNGKFVYFLEGAFNLTKDIPKNIRVQARLCQFENDKWEPIGEVYEKDICSFMRDEFSDWFPEKYIANQNFISGCPITEGSYDFKKFSPVEQDYYAFPLLRKNLKTELIFIWKGESLLDLYWHTDMLTIV